MAAELKTDLLIRIHTCVIRNWYPRSLKIHEEEWVLQRTQVRCEIGGGLLFAFLQRTYLSKLPLTGGLGAINGGFTYIESTGGASSDQVLQALLPTD